MPITKEHLLGVVEAAQAIQSVCIQGITLLTQLRDKLEDDKLTISEAIESIEYTIIMLKAGAGSGSRAIDLEEQRLRLTWASSERAKRYKQRLREGQEIKGRPTDSVADIVKRYNKQQAYLDSKDAQRKMPGKPKKKKPDDEIIDYSVGGNEDGTPIEDITGFDLDI